MASASSSTRKAARLAQKGKGKRVRFQGGTLFPTVVGIVLVLGLGLIAYARASLPAADASPPRPGVDHWHIAYGLQLCSDTPNVQMTGTLEQFDAGGNLVSVTPEYRSTGVHSHDDGLIHWHPSSARSAGRNADLGVFLDNYGVSVSNDRLALPTAGGAFTVDGVAPPDGFPDEYEEGETQCAGENGSLRAVVWDNFADAASDGQVYTSHFDDIAITGDGMVIVVAFVPDDVDVVMPAWAAELPSRGSVDTGQESPTGSQPDESRRPTSPLAGTQASQGND